MVSNDFDIERYFLDRREFIDKALEQYLKKAGRHDSRLDQAVRYSVFDGGKRFRPILTLAVGELFGAKRTVLRPFACAVELIHCYSLIHDDLPALDNDDFRRGKPSCHKKFGEAIALLAGDALLTEAFYIMSEARAAQVLGVSIIAKLIREVSNASGLRGLVGGQSMEIELVKRPVTPAVLEGLDRLKTGALITVAARLGAMIGGAARKDLNKVTRYAQALGLAFQITDDMMDAGEVVSNQNNHIGVANYASMVGPARAAKRVEGLLAECLKAMQSYGDRAQPLRALAHYVALRTAAKESRDWKVIKPEQQPLRGLA